MKMMKKNEIVSLKETIVGHNGAIYDVIESDHYLFTTSADNFVAKWDVETGKQTDFAIKLDRSAYNIAFSPNSNLLAIGSKNGDIHVVDVEKKEEIRLLQQHKSAVFSLTYNPHTNQFYSGDEKGMFCAWDGDNFDLLITLPFNCDKIREIAIDEKGEHLALCAKDGYLRILDTDYFNLVQEINAHKEGLNCALFDGDNIITGGKDAYIRKWNWKTKEQLISVPAHNYAVYDLIYFDNKEKIVSVSFDKSIKIWKAKDISIIERFEYQNRGHRHTVNRIAKLSESSFATVGDDKKIKIWELNS